MQNRRGVVLGTDGQPRAYQHVHDNLLNREAVLEYVVFLRQRLLAAGSCHRCRIERPEESLQRRLLILQALLHLLPHPGRPHCDFPRGEEAQ